MLALLWLGAITLTMAAIALDMHALGLNRIRLTRLQWAVASLLAGPLAGLVYLAWRKPAQRRLLSGISTIVESDNPSEETRAKRLALLLEAGIVSKSAGSEYLTQESHQSDESLSADQDVNEDGLPHP